MVWEVLLVILVWEVWEVVLRQPPSVVAALDQSEATKSRKQGNLLQGVPHHHTAIIPHHKAPHKSSNILKGVPHHTAN